MKEEFEKGGIKIPLNPPLKKGELKSPSIPLWKRGRMRGRLEKGEIKGDLEGGVDFEDKIPRSTPEN